MTTAPAATAMGAQWRLASVLAEMKAISTPLKESSVVSSTVNSFPLTFSLAPAERLEASSFRLCNPGWRCSTIFKNSAPTAPVAPTTAIVRWFRLGMVIFVALLIESVILHLRWKPKC